MKFTLPIETGAAGKYLLLVIDPTDTVEETDEGNNVIAAGPL